MQYKKLSLILVEGSSIKTINNALILKQSNVWLSVAFWALIYLIIGQIS